MGFKGGREERGTDGMWGRQKRKKTGWGRAWGTGRKEGDCLFRGDSSQAAGRKGMSVFGGDRGHEQAGTNFPRRGEFAGAGDEYLTGFL